MAAIFDPAVFDPNIFDVGCSVLVFDPDIYDENIFQICGDVIATLTGTIAQTLPALSQVVDAHLGAPPLKGVALHDRKMVRGSIHQTLPSLEQAASVRVSDDELVLLLIGG